jgi:L-2-hydroxyglutarate oxidase LhgO
MNKMTKTSTDLDTMVEQSIELTSRRSFFKKVAKIEKDGIIFNMTPSPGATSSLSIAKIDALSICETLGATFDSIKHVNEIECIKSSALKEPIFQEESRLQKLA